MPGKWFGVFITLYKLTMVMLFDLYHLEFAVLYSKISLIRFSRHPVPHEVTGGVPKDSLKWT